MSPTHSDMITDNPNPTPLERYTQAHREDPDIRAVHDQLGGRRSLLIIMELTHDPLRFHQLQHVVSDILQRMLTLTVWHSERDGLVHRTAYPTVPTQADYRLVEVGASLTHLLEALAD